MWGLNWARQLCPPSEGLYLGVEKPEGSLNFVSAALQLSMLQITGSTPPVFWQISYSPQQQRPVQCVQTPQKSEQSFCRTPVSVRVTNNRPQHYAVISILKPGLKTFSLNSLVKKRYPSLFISHQPIYCKVLCAITTMYVRFCSSKP